MVLIKKFMNKINEENDEGKILKYFQSKIDKIFKNKDGHKGVFKHLNIVKNNLQITIKFYFILFLISID